MKDEPVMTANGILALIMAFIGLAMAMGWFNLSEEQVGQWQTFLAQAIPFLLAGGALAAGWWARQRVKPLSKIERGE